jgi:RNA polymerase sigma factor for flagellar operon FliA
MAPIEAVGTAVPFSQNFFTNGHLRQRSRDELVLEHLPVAKTIARRLLMKLPPSVDADDIYSAGITGLLDAAERFDTSRDIKFRTYAEARIRGAILDYLRSLSWAPRRVHSQARELARARVAFEGAAGRSGTGAELAEVMGLSLEQYHLLVSEINQTELQNSEDLWIDESGRGASLLNQHPSSDPVREFEQKEMLDILRQAFRQLSERQKMLLKLYYDEEWTLKEIGQFLKVTESRVSQLHSKALAIMRREILKLVN